MNIVFSKLSSRVFRLALVLSLACLSSQSFAITTQGPSEIVVHEWGVNFYDWGTGENGHDPQLPPFYHTDEKPGIPMKSKFQVKKLSSPTSIRFKPLLYFYPKHKEPLFIGVEMSFKHGRANAWYPQVNARQSVEEMKKENQRTVFGPEFYSYRSSWGSDFYGKLSQAELVWDALALNPEHTVEPKKVDSSSWVNIARDVDAAVVSNANEAEKYVFYEGATNELPAFTIVANKQNKGYQLVNISEFPMYDVMVIYRSGTRYFSEYHPFLSPVNSQTVEAGKNVKSIPLRDYDKMKVDAVTEKVFERGLSQQLIKALTRGKQVAVTRNSISHSPAQSQPSTLSHTLFQKEAEGLEKIWHQDFFKTEGVTILYRESPAALDAAMPLRIYCDTNHIINLNRCGLVCNRNIPINNIAKLQITIDRLVAEKSLPAANDIQLCQQSRICSKTYLSYLLKMGGEPRRIQLIDLSLDAEIK